MCQILIMTNTDRVKNQYKVINTIAEHLQDSQRDGFGYAVQGKTGVFGERTVRDTFKSRINSNLAVDPVFTEVTYNSFGKVNPLMGAAIFHGRTSTNTKSLINTHPINKNGWFLIHNGVVNNHGPLYKKVTSNDTEDIVHFLSTQGIQAVEKHLSGYYAVGAIDPQGNLHVIKDDTARLFVAYNKTLDCLMFATTEDLILGIAKDLEWTVGPIDQVKNNIHLIFDKDGNLTSNAPIKPLGYTRHETQFAGQSLGYKLDNVIDYSSYKPNANLDDEDEVYVKESYNPDEADASLSAYQAEISHMDASYQVVDWMGRPMTLDDFRRLDEVTKRDCIVTRGDGTIVDPADYFTEKLA